MTDALIRLAALAIAAPGGPEGVAAVLEALRRARTLEAEAERSRWDAGGNPKGGPPQQ